MKKFLVSFTGGGEFSRPTPHSQFDSRAEAEAFANQTLEQARAAKITDGGGCWVDQFNESLAAWFRIDEVNC